MSKKLTLAYSPCPNDCYIFDAMVHHKIDTEGLEFEVLLADVEELNKKAFAQTNDITKISFHAFAYVWHNYQLLNSGSALGFNCGPLLVSKNELTDFEIKQSEYSVAIPGKYTTANFLFSLAFPKANNKKEVLFSEIEGHVINNFTDTGLIIHENRFTYQLKGLKKIVDLGEFWHSLTQMPIPLGGIAIKRNLDDKLKQKVNRVLKQSVEYAFRNPESSMAYIRSNAQEMDENVMKEHIKLYVNEFSVDLGEEGKKAISVFYNLAAEKNIIKPYENPIFIS